MTPYERGYAAGLKAAAETCKTMAEVFATAERYSGLSGAADACGSAILSLPILGEATNPGEQVPDSARIGVPLPDFDSLADIAAAKEEHDAHR